MQFSLFSSVCEAGRRRLALWLAAGTSKAAACVNLFFLAAAWLILPLEKDPWKGILARFSRVLPDPAKGALLPLDALRIVIEFVWLTLFRQPAEGTTRFVAWVKAALQGFWAKLARAGDIFAEKGRQFINRSDAEMDSVEARGAHLSPAVRKVLLWTVGLVSFGLALLTITQPFDLEGQVLFLSAMLVLAVLIVQIQARLPLMLLFVISIVVSGRYLWWRCTTTISPDSWIEIVLGLILLAAEIYAFLVMVLGYFQVCWVLDRKPAPLPADRSTWPHVDIFIPTYNESLDVIKPTVFAALNLDWPKEKLHVYLLDDGSRPAFADFMREVGAGYIKRKEHNHAKAGNINHAMTVTNGEFITIFDCDHVPSCDFLLKTMGWLVANPKIALVQTPHHFYSPDPFEKNMHLERAMPIENALFHDFIQKGNDTWNATMFCGSSAVMRRKALEEVGGIAVETVTEDAHTSLKLNRRGWSSAFIDTPVASGLSTDNLAAHIGQRIRWARGMIQIFRLDNPLLGRGLTLPQRLCFFNAMLHFFHGLPRIIFLVAPLPYMFFGTYVIYATAASIFAYVLPHMIHSALTNQRLQRGHRYPFLSGVYETILSWYILLPTTVAVIFPHKGKFNVTAKGGTIGQKYLDWHISVPYLILLGLNAAGLVVGIFKAFMSPDPEYLTLAINIGWIAYNLMILGATMAVAVEDVQPYKFPRIALRIPAPVMLPDGRIINAQMTEYSQDTVCIALENPAEAESLLAAKSAFVTLSTDGQDYRFAVTPSLFKAGGRAELTLNLTTLREEIEFNRCTFARRGMWAIAPEGHVDDRFLTGFVRLGKLALYGFASMIEFLPGRLGVIRTACRWLASFAPRSLKAGSNTLLNP